MFNTGDRVRIARVVTTEDPWRAAGYTWTQAMSACLGQEATVENASSYGVRLWGYYETYPYGSLEYVMQWPKPVNTGPIPVDPKIAEEAEKSKSVQQSLYELRRALKSGKYF